jgi:hypothetical protein
MEELMKDSVRQIVGKQIVTVVVARSDHPPKRQVFLVFADGTRFEFYGDGFSGSGGVDLAPGVEEYIESGGGKIDRVYGDVAALEPKDKARVLLVAHEDTTRPSALEDAMRRDLDAWRTAKAAIEKARR